MYVLRHAEVAKQIQVCTAFGQLLQKSGSVVDPKTES